MITNIIAKEYVENTPIFFISTFFLYTCLYTYVYVEYSHLFKQWSNFCYNFVTACVYDIFLTL